VHIENIIVINSTTNIYHKIEKGYFFLFPAAIGLLQYLESENSGNHTQGNKNKINVFTLQIMERIEKIRGGALPAIFGWLGGAWGLKNNVQQVINLVGDKKKEKQNKNDIKWTDFLLSENSNPSNQNPNSNTSFGSLIKQVGASSGSVLLIWYFLAIYNKSRRVGKKLPVPEFIMPDLVPEVRRIPFREKLYNLVMTLVDLSTPVPYAIIVLATFIYFFMYAGKSTNPIDNAFSFVNTLFQQLVKATETTQEFLTDEIRRTAEEAKNAQKELKEEHRLQRDKLTQNLNACENQISEILVTNNYLGQVNQNLNGHLQMCEQQSAKEYEINQITAKKIIEFGAIIKKEDGSFNQDKFNQLTSEIKDVIDNGITSSKILQKIQQRSEDRLYQIERSQPPFPIKKVVEYNSPANQFIDGVLNLFGIQIKSNQKGQIIKRSSYENFSNKDKNNIGGEAELEGK